MQPIAENIYQIRLPLPFALNHINCYLLYDDDGWTMLDTGLNWQASQQAWQAAFRELHIGPAQIHRIILTHMHPDHYGMAGYFQTLTHAPIYLSPREAALAQTVWVENGWRQECTRDFWQLAGVTGTVLDTVAQQTERLRQMTMPHPTNIQTLAPGTTLTMAGRSWQAIQAPGHADGQLIFFAAADQLMLCGDQVLMKITPNIGCWPTTAPDPLGRYLQSLAELAQLNVTLALPGHGRPIQGWQARLSELQTHHATRLTEMTAAATGVSALAVAQRIFNFERFSEHEVRFAVAETLAHLEYLLLHQQLSSVDQAGVRLYQN